MSVDTCCHDAESGTLALGNQHANPLHGERDTDQPSELVVHIASSLPGDQHGKSHAGDCGVAWRLWVEVRRKRLESLQRRPWQANKSLLAPAHGSFWTF